MRDKLTDNCFFGSVTVGERGQIVIPSDVRRALQIESGDRLLIFMHPFGHGIILTRIENVQEVTSYFQRALDGMAKTVADEPSPAEDKD